MLPGSDAVMSHIDNFEASANQIAFSQICSFRLLAKEAELVCTCAEEDELM